MRNIYCFIKSFFVVFFMCLPLVNPALGQLTLESSLPVDGATTVSSPVTFQFTFNSALDTTARFHEPDGFFLNVEFFPEDSLGDPQDITLSPDLRTVTVSGLEFPPDTRLTLLLSGAKNISGDFLDRPYVINFTTGSTLPTGSVSGEVTFPGNTASGAVVVLFGEDSFDDEPLFVGVANSPYTINFVADGTYTVFSVKDTNEDGEIDPSGGDAIGVYDANGDGQPDVIQVSGGNTVSGIDITLTEPSPETARSRLTDIETAAQSWSSDAGLVAVHSEYISTSGQSFGWSYLFYSPLFNQFQEFFTFGDMVMSEAFDDMFEPDSTALPDVWVDSDSAASLAESNGGSDFRTNFVDAEVYASLEYFYLYHPEDSLGPTAQYHQSFFPSKLHYSKRLYLSIENFTNETISDLAVWRFNYWSEETMKYLNIEINAETGTLLASDAHSNLEAADLAAENWSLDAELIKIRSESELSPEGLSTVWGFVYHSTSLDTALEFIAVSGTVLDIRPWEYGIPPFGALPDQFCNSTEAIVIAQQYSEDFRAMHPDVFIFADLTRGIAEDPTLAVWRISYNTFSEEYLEVMIDAETCALITNIENLSEIPTEFVLKQNYPNPFNPTTEINYQLFKTGQVELTIFNLLGQKIKTMVNAVQPAGSYKITWNGTNEQENVVPSGIYIYHLKTSEFSQTRKMLLLR